MHDGIQYTIANYSKIPFGKQMLGKIFIPSSKSGCNSIEQLNAATQGASFLLLEESTTCNSLEKSKNAEKSGAKLVIIISSVNNADFNADQSESLDSSEIDSTVAIPTIFIS